MGSVVASTLTGAGVNTDSLDSVVDGGAAGRKDAASVRAPSGSVHSDSHGSGLGHVSGHGGLAGESVVVGDGEHLAGG